MRNDAFCYISSESALFAKVPVLWGGGGGGGFFVCSTGPEFGPGPMELCDFVPDFEERKNVKKKKNNRKKKKKYNFFSVANIPHNLHGDNLLPLHLVSPSI